MSGSELPAQLHFIKKRHEAGDPLALYDGLIACQRADCALPDWLMAATKQAVMSALTGQPVRSRGHPQQLFVHYVRWSTAQTIIGAQNGDLPLFTLPIAIIKMFWDDEFSLGRTKTRAFEIASEALSGTFAQGSDRQVKDSYNKLQSQIRKEGLRYLEMCTASLETLRDFGHRGPQSSIALEDIPPRIRHHFGFSEEND